MIFKTIILIPHPSLPGGVSNYYKVAKKHFSSNIKYVNFNSKFNKGIIKAVFNHFIIVKVLVLIVVCFPKRVVVNPSLNRIAFLRDGLFVFWSHLLLKKTIVFWRGWDPKNEIIFTRGLYQTVFKYSYLKSNKHFVLNQHIKAKLIELGVKNENIFLTNTIVDDTLINYHYELPKKDVFIVLFLTRIEKYKGIYETLEIFEALNLKDLNIELHIAGDGSELKKISNIVLEKEYKNIKFLGYVKGEEKIKAYKNADVYLFPSYNEGMPNSVVEAMGSGLPVVCTEVGALGDFFEDGVMGYIHPLPIINDAFVSSILNLYFDKELRNRISDYNYQYAKQSFMASKSVQALENLIVS